MGLAQLMQFAMVGAFPSELVAITKPLSSEERTTSFVMGSMAS